MKNVVSARLDLFPTHFAARQKGELNCMSVYDAHLTFTNQANEQSPQWSDCETSATEITLQ